MLMRTLFIAGNWKMNPSSTLEACHQAWPRKSRLALGSMGEVQVDIVPADASSSTGSTSVLDSHPNRPGRPGHALRSLDGAYTGSTSGCDAR